MKIVYARPSFWRALWIAVLASMIFFLTSCASVGERKNIPVTIGNERVTIVAHNQPLPDWLLDKDTMAINYIVKGDVSEKQLAAVAETERACRIYTNTVRPGNLVAVLSHGVLYATAGYIGVGVGSRVFAGTVQSQYAEYGAWATGIVGMANGIVTFSGQTYTFENCGREILALFPQYKVRVLQKSPY